MTSKERGIFKNLYNEDLDKIKELTKKINYGDLKFAVKRTGVETDFSDKIPVSFLNNNNSDNNSESLLNEIRQMVYSFYQ